MYDKLIEELRRHHCDAKEDDTQEVCEECAYDVIIADKSVPSGIASVYVCGLMNRAADAIEELSAIREEQKAQIIAMAAEDKLRWIPVSERLPDAGERVLCYCRANIYEVMKMRTDGDWVYGTNHIYMHSFVTHWMPLPEPPKEE